MRGIATIGVIGASLAVWLPNGAVAAGDVHYCSQVGAHNAYADHACDAHLDIGTGC